MQSMVAIAAISVFLFAFASIKSYGRSAVAFLRVFVKRLALCIMSFSWIVFSAAVLMSACYSDISGLLKDLLPSNSIACIKNLIRFVFGVDSAYIALDILALYSMIASFISCLVLSAGVVIRFVYRTILKAVRTPYAEDKQCFEEFGRRSTYRFKLFLKYNS